MNYKRKVQQLNARLVDCPYASCSAFLSLNLSYNSLFPSVADATEHQKPQTRLKITSCHCMPKASGFSLARVRFSTSRVNRVVDYLQNLASLFGLFLIVQ
jgi:hypothetical protein